LTKNVCRILKPTVDDHGAVREALDEYLRAFGRRLGEFLFPSRRDRDRCITTRQYARLVSGALRPSALALVSLSFHTAMHAIVAS
jgi:hypothetical protein